MVTVTVTKSLGVNEPFRSVTVTGLVFFVLYLHIYIEMPHDL